MKKILTYILIWVSLAACTLYEKSSIEEIQRPGAAIKVDSARQINLYVFGPSDTLFYYEQFDSTAVVDSLDILDGVPESRYRVVSFVNCNRYRFSTMTIGKSSYDDLECEMVDFLYPSGDPIATADSIRYGNEFIETHWGQRLPLSIAKRDLYYDIGVRITIADGYNFWDDINLTSMEFRRLPRRFDKKGISSDPSVVFMISKFDHNDPNKIAATLRVPRFKDEDHVELHVVSKGYSLGSVVLLPSKFNVTADSPDRISFVVDFHIQPREMTISVKDWVAGTIQTTIVGQ